MTIENETKIITFGFDTYNLPYQHTSESITRFKNTFDILKNSFYTKTEQLPMINHILTQDLIYSENCHLPLHPAPFDHSINIHVCTKRIF